MKEREYIAIGFTKTENGIIVEGYCEEGEYNINLAKKNLSKYNDTLEIDVTELTPEEVITKYSETINNKQMYSSIFTTGSSASARISTFMTEQPLKHMLSMLMIPGNHIIMYGGNISIEININSFDYYYGEQDIITSSKVISF